MTKRKTPSVSSGTECAKIGRFLDLFDNNDNIENNDDLPINDPNEYIGIDGVMTI